MLLKSIEQKAGVSKQNRVSPAVYLHLQKEEIYDRKQRI